MRAGMKRNGHRSVPVAFDKDRRIPVRPAPAIS